MTRQGILKILILEMPKLVPAVILGLIYLNYVWRLDVRGDSALNMHEEHCSPIDVPALPPKPMRVDQSDTLASTHTRLVLNRGIIFL